MVKSTNTSAIATATGRTWEDWVRMLDEAGARQLNHTKIAALALQLMPETTEQQEWWAQGTAVAYEQHVGLRVPGQTSDGDFQVSTSKTVPGDKDTVLAAWQALVDHREAFDGVATEGEPTTSSTEKWRYWRIQLADGSRVAVNIRDTPSGKASIGLVHSKLDSPEAIERWKPVWKALLGQVADAK